MFQSIRPYILVALACLVAFPASTARSESDVELPWGEDEFRKRFLGEYGYDPATEPELSAVEKEQLKEILPLLQSTEPDDIRSALEQIEAITTDASSALLDFTLGQLHVQLEEPAEAIGWYESALEKAPGFRRAHKTYGMLQYQNGQCEDSVKSLSRVIELGGGDSTVYGLLGICLNQLRQPVSAESAFRNAILLDPGELNWKVGLTQSVVAQQKFAEAVTLAEELLARYEDRTDFWILQANAYIGLGKPVRAAENFEIVRRMGGATVRTQRTLGDIYVNEGLYQLAAKAYGHALEIDAQEAKGLAFRGSEVLLQRGANDAASQLIAKLEETAGPGLDDEERKQLLKIESRIAVAEGRGGQAAEVLEEIVSLDPLDGEALMLLGDHYRNEGEDERAVLYYQRAASIEDFEADANVKLASLFVQLGRVEEAVPLLKRAQQIEPRSNVADFIEQIEKYLRSRR